MQIGLLSLAVMLGGGLMWAGDPRGNYGARVVDYSPGTDESVLTDPTMALGEPSRRSNDPTWGAYPVDPFSPAYLPDQIVGLGPGGQLTLELAGPVLDDPAHAYGTDFIVFGNAFFQLNGDWTTTSGEIGGVNEGTTVVSVSADGEQYFPLQMPPERVGIVDGLYPTDGSGDFTIPVDPALGASDFIGRDIDGVRELYAGSGGGTGFDIRWAIDEQGEPVELSWVRFVRFEQTDGKAQLDAVSGLGPRVDVATGFERSPFEQGWTSQGEPDLFSWDPEVGALAVTWDSSKPNAFCYRSLGTVLGRDDDFQLGFDLRLDSIVPGATEGKPGTFQIALGLVELESVLRPEFFRGAGAGEMGARNVVEFDYFPAVDFPASISPVLVPEDNTFSNWSYANQTLTEGLPQGDWLRVTMRFTAADGVLRTTVTRGEETVTGQLAATPLAPEVAFRLDTLAICSYSDEGQPPAFAGSVFATGWVDNFWVATPPLPINSVTGRWEGADWTVTVDTQPGWTYELKRTGDLAKWETVDTLVADDSTPLQQLRDADPVLDCGLYRVEATRP